MAPEKPPDSTARVMVVNPRPAERAEFVHAIGRRSNLEVVSQVGGGLSAREEIVRLTPDVAVIDLHLLGLDALRVLEAIGKEDSQTRVLLMSGYDDGPILYQAIEAGAAGCLMSDANADTICRAIAAVARGEYVFTPQVATMIAEQMRARRHRNAGTLSERERTILRLTADGLPATRVGEELAISESTVKTHLTHIYVKLGVSCAAAAVYEAMRLDILT
jgi:two-component system nitrate/nitrite response regulator NarL